MAKDNYSNKTHSNKDIGPFHKCTNKTALLDSCLGLQLLKVLGKCLNTSHSNKDIHLAGKDTSKNFFYKL